MPTYLVTKTWKGDVPQVTGGAGTLVDARKWAPAAANP